MADSRSENLRHSASSGIKGNPAKKEARDDSPYWLYLPGKKKLRASYNLTEKVFFSEELVTIIPQDALGNPIFLGFFLYPLEVETAV